MQMFYNGKDIDLKEIIEKQIKLNSKNLQKLEQKVGVSNLIQFIDFIEEKYNYIIKEDNKPMIVILFDLLRIFGVKYRIKNFDNIGHYKIISYCKLGKLIADNYRIKEFLSIKFDLVENNTIIAKVQYHNRKINGNSILGIFDIDNNTPNMVESMLNEIYSLLNLKI